MLSLVLSCLLPFLLADLFPLVRAGWLSVLQAGLFALVLAGLLSLPLAWLLAIFRAGLLRLASLLSLTMVGLLPLLLIQLIQLVIRFAIAAVLGCPIRIGVVIIIQAALVCMPAYSPKGGGLFKPIGNRSFKGIAIGPAYMASNARAGIILFFYPDIHLDCDIKELTAALGYAFLLMDHLPGEAPFIAKLFIQPVDTELIAVSVSIIPLMGLPIPGPLDGLRMQGISQTFD